MGPPERAVTALARAYSMSEVFAFEEPPVREEVAVVASCEREVAFEVAARGIAVDGELLDDSDGSLAELSRDLGLAGVAEVRISAASEEESVESFLRGLREGTDELGQSLEEQSEISVSFRPISTERSRESPTKGSDSALESGVSAGFARSVASLFPAGEPDASGTGGPGMVSGARDGLGAAGTEAGSGATEEAPPASGVEVPASAEDEPSEEPAEERSEEPATPDLVPHVDAYLESTGEEREELEGELRRKAGEAARLDAHERVAEAVERLILEADPEDGREEAVNLARDLFGPDVAAAIVRRLGALRDDAERERRIRVASTLRGPMAPAFSDGLAETDDRGARHAYLDALIALGEDGRAEARKMLEDSRWWMIRNGATILGGTGRPTDVEDLTTHLAHDDARVRLQTVRALAHIGGDDAGMLLLGMVDDPDPDVRAAVATALGALEPDRAVKSLLERLEAEEEQKVEVQIVRALGALGDPGAVPSIEKRAVGSFFSRSPTAVRVAAYRALASIGTPKATQLLEDARDDRNDEVRRTVRGILERRGE